MFVVGEKVVYPMHGVGVVEKIEEREVLDKNQLYYFVKLDHGEMTVMVPVEHSEKLRLRKILPEESMEKVFSIFDNPCESIHQDWKVRFSHNQTKLKEGSVQSLSEVVRDLYHRNHIKELSRGEKKLYDNAFQLLGDELAYTEKMESTDVRIAIIKYLKAQVTVPA